MQCDPPEKLIVDEFPSLGVLQAQMANYAEAERALELVRRLPGRLKDEKLREAEQALQGAYIEFKMRSLRLWFGEVSEDLKSVELQAIETVEQVQVVPHEVRVRPNGDFVFTGVREGGDSEGYRKWRWRDTFTVTFDDGLWSVSKEHVNLR